jgi:hypothetical protein
MTTDLLGTASGFEILFFLSALVGLRFSIPNFRLSWAQYRSLGGARNGRRAIAVEGIALEIIFIGIHSLYVIAALVAFSIPAAPVVTAAGILIQSILVIVSWGITGCSWIIRRTGTYLLEHGLQARGPDGRFVRDD